MIQTNRPLNLGNLRLRLTSNCSAEALFSGFGSIQRLRKCTRAGDQRGSFSFGGGLMVIMRRALSGASDKSGGCRFICLKEGRYQYNSYMLC